MSISVFIGSSFREMSYRKRIGNRIRQLNDVWEQKGVRIYLKQWEDFRVQYRGKSKQQEYIDELVLPSDICIFFFGERIGKFTERELDACLTAKKTVHCYRVPAKDGTWRAEICSKLKTKGITPIDCSTLEVFADDVIAKIESYINNLHLANNTPISHLTERWLYTTIPDDNKDRRDEFGTIVRNVDDQSELFLGIRCKLHEMNQIHLLEDTDHYVAYCKRDVSENDLKEIRRGVELLDDKGNRLKDVTFFVTKDSKIHESNAAIKGLLGPRELFTCKVKDADTIRWKLFSWLMGERNIMLNMTTSGVSLQNNYLLWNGSPVVSMKTLDSTGKAFALSVQRDSISRQLVGNHGLDHVQRKRLQAELHEMEAILWLHVTNCVNKWILNEMTDKVQSELEQGDMDGIKRASAVIEEQYLAAEEQRKSAIDNWRKLLSTLDAQITQIEAAMGGENAVQLKNLLEQKEAILRNLVQAGAAEPLQLMSTQLYLVGLYDTFIYRHQQPKEEDELYLRVINDADCFELNDANVEMMRMNYGNSFNRQEKYGDALKHYRKAEENIERMKGDGWLLRRYRTIIYAMIFHTYREMGNIEGMNRILPKMKAHVDDCMSRNEVIFLADKAMYMGALLCGEERYDGNENALNEAVRVFDLVEKRLQMEPTDQWFADIYCFLPNQIAGCYIDQRKYNNTVLHHLKRALYYATRLMQINRKDGLFHCGEILHQMGFFYYNRGLNDWQLAEKCYMDSLHCKKELMSDGDSFEHERSYAQTLVNLGAVEVSMLDIASQLASQGVTIFPHPKYNPIEFATIALSIYKKHLNKESVNSEQNYYEALQLLGTAYYYDGKLHHNDSLISKSIPLLQECWQWNLSHPTNTYRDRFKAHSYTILKELGII